MLRPRIDTPQISRRKTASETRRFVLLPAGELSSKVLSPPPKSGMTESIMETAQILLTNLSKQLGLESVDLDDEGCAALSFDEIVVNFEYDPESDLLAFYSDIGSIPPIEDTPRELLESLLKANFFHTGTAGATIGMDRESGFISLFQTLSPTAVEPDRFFSALETFVDLAEGWTKRIPELVSGEEVTSSRDKRDPDYPGDMIRI